MQHTKPRYLLAEACRLLGFSRAKLYRRIRDGSLKTVRDGETQFVTADELDRYSSESHGPIDYGPQQQSRPPEPPQKRKTEKGRPQHRRRRRNVGRQQQPAA